MLYCSDCDKDVEFKSLDVGGKLTHFCSDCGETNLFKGKEEYEEVGKLLERKTGKKHIVKDNDVVSTLQKLIKDYGS